MADNATSQPTIKVPTIPTDFEKKCGTSKTDFATALFQLLAGATVDGLTPSGATPYDLTAIVSQLEALQAQVDKQVKRTPRRIIMDYSADGLLIIPFQDVGTTNYQVDLAFSGPNGPIDDGLGWHIINDSKQTNQVQVRIKGGTTGYRLEITITPMDGI